MKKHLIIGLSLTSLFLFSCDKETPEPEEPTVPTPTPVKVLNGTWVEGEWETMQVTGTDTTLVHGEYVGDGYCCGVTLVNATGSSYLTGDTVDVGGKAYVISNYVPDGTSLNDDYRYYVELEIVTPANGSKSYLNLFKRTAD